MRSMKLDPLEDTVSQAYYLLRRGVPALQFLGMQGDRAQFGPVIRIPRGEELEDCGYGLNEDTLKVRHGECYYIVYRQHLDFDQGIVLPLRM